MILQRVNYEPSFKGKHNRTKVKVFIILYSIRESRGITAKELAARAGVNVRTLYTELPKWEKWKYISCSNDKPHLWRIRDKAEQWLTRWYPIMPFDEYIEEIRNERKI